MSTNKSESFDGVTGRDFWIVPRALYIASKALRIAPYFADSDADDVEAILNAKFPGAIERERMWDWIREAEEMGLGHPPEGRMTPEGIKAWIEAANATGASVAAAFNRSGPFMDGDWIYYNLDSAENPLHCYARIDETLWGDDAFVVAYSKAAPSGDGGLIELDAHMMRITAEEAETARTKGWPAPSEVISGWPKAA